MNEAEDHGRSGGVGLTRSYRRLHGVEAEIAALPATEDPEFVSAVVSAAALETIVHAIRRLLRAGDDAGGMALAEVLVTRAAAVLARAARNQFPDAIEDQRDVVQSVSFQLWREAFDTSPKEEFWEVNFHHMVTAACSDAADRIRRQRVRERQFERRDDDDGFWDEEAEVPDLALAKVDDGLLAEELLEDLDEDVRQVVELRAKGVKTRSNNPSEKTITQTLGVTDRTVRNRIDRAQEAVRQGKDRRPERHADEADHDEQEDTRDGVGGPSA